MILGQFPKLTTKITVKPEIAIFGATRFATSTKISTFFDIWFMAHLNFFTIEVKYCGSVIIVYLIHYFLFYTHLGIPIHTPGQNNRFRSVVNQNSALIGLSTEIASSNGRFPIQSDSIEVEGRSAGSGKYIRKDFR